MLGKAEIGLATVFDQMVNNPTPTLALGVMSKVAKNKMDIKSFRGTRDYAKFGQQLAKSLADLSPSELRDIATDYDLALAPQVQQARTALAQTYNDVVATAATAPVYGVSNAQTLQHVDAISRGNAPPGSSPNAVGGYSTPDFSVNSDGDVMGPGATQQMNDVQTLGISMTDEQRTNLGYGFVDPDLAKDIEEAKELANEIETITGVDMQTGPVGPIGGTIGEPGLGDDTGVGAVGQTESTQSDQAGGVPGPDPDPDTDTDTGQAAEE